MTNFAALKPEDLKEDMPIVDGRLMFGNGYVLGSFVGPFEFPEVPSTKVHDKISRLWLGYSSPQMAQVGLGVTIVEEKTGKKWTVGASDEYRFEDGVIHMKTRLPIGIVQTETFGLWEQPVLIRHIEFTPKDGFEGKYTIQTKMQLYKDFDNAPPKDPELLRIFHQAYVDKREIPPRLVFPEVEKIYIDKDAHLATWSYENPHYRKVVVGVLGGGASIEVAGDEYGTKDNYYYWKGEKSGGLSFEKKLSESDNSLTIVLAFGDSEKEARETFSDLTKKSIKSDYVKSQWCEWFESGTVVRTGNDALDQAFRNQMMFYKISQCAELGGMIVGGRYHITTVWTRDSGVGISALLEAGHYEECKLGLEFYMHHAAWNVRNHCLHANYHASGKVSSIIAGPTQVSAEEVVQPFKRDPNHVAEWGIQMSGPQLDGMAYFLYNVGKYERRTGDMEFIKSIWPFVMQVGHALAADRYLYAEAIIESDFLDKHRYFRKFNPETGLIVDNVYEDGILREHIITNGLAVMGFREAYRLSQKMGEPVTIWRLRAEQLDKHIRKHLVRENDQGKKYFLEWVPRDWLTAGKEVALGVGGYPLTIASVVPYLNWRDPIFRESIKLNTPAHGRVAGWGMWFATLAHAAFEADQSEIAWNYLGQLVNKLPPSRLMYEHNNLVYCSGERSRATLNLFGYAYLPPAVIRGFAGIGFDEWRREYFFRPQIPDEFGAVKSQVRIGETFFEVTSVGNGNTVDSFIINDIDYTSKKGILPAVYLDGGRHTVEIKMRSN